MSAKNNRLKGCQYERDIAKILRDLGWVNCRTSRYESKFLDDQKVDLTNTYPFQIQAKNTLKLGSPQAILKSMPQKEGVYNLLFNKRKHQGSVVIMTQEDFIEILKMLVHNDIITPKC